MNVNFNAKLNIKWTRKLYANKFNCIVKAKWKKAKWKKRKTRNDRNKPMEYLSIVQHKPTNIWN